MPREKDIEPKVEAKVEAAPEVNAPGLSDALASVDHTHPAFGDAHMVALAVSEFKTIVARVGEMPKHIREALDAVMKAL